jgi:cell division septal protein FtsQ
MDDRELDRLFGNDSESDKETLKKDNKVRENKPDRKPRKNDPEASPKKEAGKKRPDRKEPEKKVPEKVSEKSSEKKEEAEKKAPEKAPEKKPSGKKDPEKKTEDKAPKDSKEEKKHDNADDIKLSEDKSSGDAEHKDEEDSKDESPKNGSEEDKKDPEENKSDEEIKEETGEKTEDKESDSKDQEEAGGVEEERKPDEEHRERRAPGPAKEHKQRTRREPVPKEPEEVKSLSEIIPLSGKSIVAICLALAVVVMVVLVMFLPAFRVRNTSVEGNVVLTDQEILKAVGLEYDAHLMSGVSGNILDILRLDYGKTEQRIKKENPYVEDIRITIKLPSTVDIKVKERSKICYVRTPDGYAALDKDGIVLELSSFDSGRNVRPVICGLNVKYAELGKKIKIDNMNDYKKSIIVLGAILAADNASVGGDYSMFEHTSEVRILPSGYIFLTIYSPSGTLIQIKLNGTDSIGDKMAWLLYLFNADAFDKITVDGALDMTGDEYIFDEYD